MIQIEYLNKSKHGNHSKVLLRSVISFSFERFCMIANDKNKQNTFLYCLVLIKRVSSILYHETINCFTVLKSSFFYRTIPEDNGFTLSLVIKQLMA